MRILNLSFSDPQHNLACDEALLDAAEHDSGEEVLRFWEPSAPFVVVGHSDRVEKEVDTQACETLGIPVLRRHSGGGTVLQEPGCLDYALVLRIPESGPLSTITGTNAHVMRRHRDVVASLTGREIAVRGHSDLSVGELKFSGNAQRRGSRWLLFHGVFLLAADLVLIEKVLRFPTEQPAYRHGRSHLDFLTNLAVSSRALTDALAAAWGASEPLVRIPHARIEQLARDRYSSDTWNRRF